MAATRGRLGALGAVLLAAGLQACAPAVDTAAPGAPAAVTITPEMIAQGQALFVGAGNCRVCHANNARGGSLGPDLTSDDWIWIQPGQDLHTQLVAIIRDGIPQPRQFPAPMPARGGGSLTDAQIEALAAYVGSL